MQKFQPPCPKRPPKHTAKQPLTYMQIYRWRHFAHPLMLLALLLALVLLAPPRALASDARVFFMPRDSFNALSSMTHDIDGARRYIDVAIYSFTNKQIGAALMAAATRGVKIRIVYDLSANIKNGRPNRSSTIGWLAKLRGVSACLLRGLSSEQNSRRKRRHNYGRPYYGLMHNKLMIIDGKIVYLGSANYSKAAFSINYENLIRLKDKGVIDRAEVYYQSLRKACVGY